MNGLVLDTSHPFCGAGLKMRVCAYCEKAIPTTEDPCHFCGRLQPADDIDKLWGTSNVACEFPDEIFGYFIRRS